VLPDDERVIQEIRHELVLEVVQPDGREVHRSISARDSLLVLLI